VEVFFLKSVPSYGGSVLFPCMSRSRLRWFHCQKVSCVMWSAAGVLVDQSPLKTEINIAVQISALSCISPFSVVGDFSGRADSFPETTKKLVEMDSNFFFFLHSHSKSCEIIFPAFEIVGAVALLCCELLHSLHRAGRTLSVASERRRRDVNLERKHYFNVDFFSVSWSNRRRFRSPANVFCPRATGLLQTVSSSRECQSIMCLESAHTTS